MIVEEKKAGDSLCVRGGSTFPAGCVGSRCMAWRWHEEAAIDQTTQWPALVRSTTHGFCGLAGRP